MLQNEYNQKQIEEKKIEQEIVNQELRRISEEFKRIPNIEFDYIAVLIYIIYECQENDIKFNIPQNEIEVKELDYFVEKIRQKEGKKDLFSNIKFSEVINKENSISFQYALKNLENLIKKLEKINKTSNSKQGKAMLAEAFEYIIMKSAKNDEITLKNGEFYTPKGVIKAIAQLLDIKDNMEIFDPACGTGRIFSRMCKTP